MTELQKIYREAQMMFSDDDKPKSFWQKHKGKIIAGAALAGLGGLGYAYRDPIKEKAQEAYAGASHLAEKAYYKYWMSEEDAKKILDEITTLSTWLKEDGWRENIRKAEKLVKFCIYNAGDNQPPYLQKVKGEITALFEKVKSATSLLGYNELRSKLEGWLNALKK
jgi:hypothetical protein